MAEGVDGRGLDVGVDGRGVDEKVKVGIFG